MSWRWLWGWPTRVVRIAEQVEVLVLCIMLWTRWILALLLRTRLRSPVSTTWRRFHMLWLSGSIAAMISSSTTFSTNEVLTLLCPASFPYRRITVSGTVCCSRSSKGIRFWVRRTW